MLDKGPLSQLDSPSCFTIKAQLAAGNSNIFWNFHPETRAEDSQFETTSYLVFSPHLGK